MTVFIQYYSITTRGWLFIMLPPLLPLIVKKILINFTNFNLIFCFFLPHLIRSSITRQYTRGELSLSGIWSVSIIHSFNPPANVLSRKAASGQLRVRLFIINNRCLAFDFVHKSALDEMMGAREKRIIWSPSSLGIVDSRKSNNPLLDSKNSNELRG